MSWLSSAWPWVLAVIVLIALLILIGVILLLRRSSSRSEFEDDAEAEAPEEVAPRPVQGSLPASFRQALRRIRSHVSGAQPRYQLPWCLVVGEEGSRPHAMFASTGLVLPFGEMDRGEGEGGLRWWFFDHGILLDLDGDYVLSADGRSSDEVGWRRFLNLLERHRPRRPLDSILVTLSARELRTAKQAGAEGIAQLNRRANLLYRKLWQIQQRLGIRSPVYILVTECEVVDGFDAFAAALPEVQREGILGWSNPYSMATAYRSELADEALGSLRRRLDEVRLDLYAAGWEGSRADGLFMFPEALTGLGEPLRVFLDQFFKSSSYHEAIPFRGLYFCGQYTPHAGGGVSLSQVEMPATAERTLFLRDLLTAKIFPEAIIAGPTAGTVFARNRKVRWLQGALVVLLVLLLGGVSWAYARLARDRDALEYVFREMRPLLATPAASEAVLISDPELRRQTFTLTREIGKVRSRDFDSVFLPASWISDFDESLNRRLARAFESSALEMMRRHLEADAAALRPAGVATRSSARDRFIAWDAGTASDSDALTGGLQVVVPSATQEFEALEAHLDRLAELERDVSLYNAMPPNWDGAEIALTLRQLTGIEPPVSFEDNHAFFARISPYLGGSPFTTEEVTRQHVVPATHRLVDDLYDRLFENNFLLRATRAVSRDLARVTQGGSLRMSQESFGELNGLLLRLESLEVALSHPGLEWISEEPYDLGPGFQGLVNEIRASSLLGPEVADKVVAEGLSRWTRLRDQLALQKVNATIHLLSVGPGGGLRLELSPDVLVLKATIRALLGQSFVGGEASSVLARCCQDDLHMSWDLQLLNQARGLEEVYQRFENQTLRGMAPQLRSSVDQLARGELGNRMLDLIAQAQNLEPSLGQASPLLREQQLKAEIESFGAALPALGSLVQQFKDLSQWNHARELEGIVVTQGGRLLVALDRLLQAEAPYEPLGGSFAWWEGEAPVSLPAFGEATPEGLIGYLSNKRRRMQELASSFAEPLLSWRRELSIDRQSDFRELFPKWESILLALKEYEVKKPGNSVAELERFITETMSIVTPRNCPEPGLPLAVARVQEASDYFLAQRNQLRRQLAERCQVLAAEQILACYPAIGELFNTTLSGRYPFVPAPRGPEERGAGGDGFLTATGNATPAGAQPGVLREAELADIEDFFLLYDPQVDLIRSACATQPRGYEERCGRLLSFLAQMGEVRGFFGHYLDREDPKAPLAYEVRVEFRVNQEDPLAALGATGAQAVPGSAARDGGSSEVERGGDQIIDWQLAIGNQESDLRRESGLVWLPGLPVELALRWARNAPRVPLAGSPLPVIAADGRTATFHYDNRWSLLRLLAENPSRDPRRHTLRFEIPTASSPLPAADAKRRSGRASPTPANPNDAARVYVRLTLRPPAVEGQPASVLTLPSFPSRAPTLRLDRGAGAVECQTPQRLPVRFRNPTAAAPATREPAPAAADATSGGRS